MTLTATLTHHKLTSIPGFPCSPLLGLVLVSALLSGCGQPDGESAPVSSMYTNDGPPCAEVSWPNLPVVHIGAAIKIDAPADAKVATAIVPGISETIPEALDASSTLRFDTAGVHTAFVMSFGDVCASVLSRREVVVVDNFGIDTGIGRDDERIVAWASDWLAPVAFGTDVDEQWQTPERAMGPATGRSTDIVSLGAGGHIEVFFEGQIFNGDGDDFAIFENSFLSTFLELATVEVSSDGEHYAKFPVIYLGTAPVDPFGAHDPSLMYGFAGRHVAGVGTPFNLDALKDDPVVQAGLVDLDAISSIRITDVIGDGSLLDTLGQPVFDPYPTTGSAGFDLEAVGVLYLR
ncbi:MAG: hypothetical protein ACON3Z_15440 [Bradymonadia bacterium]